MDLTTITVAQFQALFFRDFPYLPVYSNTQVYQLGNITQYTDGGFYKCRSNGTVGIPCTTALNWEPVPCDNINDFVQAQDITNAFAEAQILFNQAFFGTTAQITLGYLYLTAHFLVTDLRRSNAGLSSRPELLVSQRSVGGVSETYAIPEQLQNEAILNGYLKTGYGMKYLDMILPQLVGNVGVVAGTVLPT